MCRTNITTRSVRPTNLKFRGLAGKKPYLPLQQVQQQDQQPESRRQEEEQPQPHYQQDVLVEESVADAANRSTLCSICKVDTGSFNLNYGANSCLSCRAFFRRAIQKTRDPNFVCKNDSGPCQINEETRRNCKRCRYDLCLAAGMRSDCVMQGDQVQQRFAKYIQRKKGIDKKATTMALLNEVRKRGVRKEKRRGRRRKSEVAREREDKKQDLLKVACQEIVDMDEEANDAMQEDDGSAMPNLNQLSFHGIPFAESDGDMADVFQEVHSPSSSSSSHTGSTGYHTDELGHRSDDPDVDITALFDLDLLPSEESAGEELGLPPVSPLGSNHSGSSHEDVATSSHSSGSVILGSSDLANDWLEEVIHDKDFQDASEKVNSVREGWEKACAEARPTGRMVADVLKGLSGQQRLEPSLFEELKACHLAVFRNFASTQLEATSIPPSDAAALADKNSGLFLQYIFGRVVAAASASLDEQLQWLLLMDEAPTVSESSLFRPVDLHDLQKAFVDDGDRQQYVAAAEKLRFRIPFRCTGSMALLCLLNTENGVDEALTIPRAQVDSVRSDYLHQLDLVHDLADGFASAVASALELKRIAESDSLMADCEKILALPELSDLFAEQEEDAWVRRQLRDFDLVFDRINFGPEFVKECVMYSLGVPLSKHFIPKATRVAVERLRAAMTHHREFRALSVGEREAAVGQAAFAGAAVARAKLENCGCGNEQFRLAFGAEDKACFCQLFQTQQGAAPKLRLISVSEWNASFGLVDSATLARFAELTGPASPLASLVRDEEQYKLLALLSAFGSSGHASMQAVAQRYLRALKRRMASVTSAAPDSEMDARIRAALADVEELTRIVKVLATSA